MFKAIDRLKQRAKMAATITVVWAVLVLLLLIYIAARVS